MNMFGELIRLKRESSKLLLRQIAAFLEVDTAFISKVERGERNASREQVLKLAEILDIPTQKILTVWLADKIANIITNDKESVNALKLVLKNIEQK